MKEQYDVVIVGAGPSGASAALYFKRTNVKVLLVDKAIFPRDKVCGDGIPLKTFNLIEELGIQEGDLFNHGYKIQQLRVYSPHNKITVYGNIHPDASTKSGCIPRLNFDNILFEHATSVVDDFYVGFRLIKIGDYTDGGRELVFKELKTEKIYTTRANLLVGADGANSLVARYIGLRHHVDKDYFDGLRRYFESSREFYPSIHLFYDLRTIPGYVWIFPVSPYKANVGIMTTKQTLKQQGKNLKELFIEVLETNAAIQDILRDSRPVGRFRGAPLVLGTLPGKRIADGILLIGDAAGFINPITGGGIYYGILSAKYAAIFGSEAIKTLDTSVKSLQKYESWWRKTILPGFYYSDWLKRKFESPKFITWFLNQCSKNRFFANFFISIYGRPLSKFAFVHPKFWYQIFFQR
ncbi:MAG: geranylgeranyl reductase family protein [Calditrichaeota bacterium]|nr:MAG: geranylgeranyl reductase family protein [Calditrichota bacterium]